MKYIIFSLPAPVGGVVSRYFYFITQEGEQMAKQDSFVGYNQQTGAIERWDARQGAWAETTPGDRRPVATGDGWHDMTEHEAAALAHVKSNEVQRSEVVGDYRDRAEGFQIATVPIALAFGVGVLLVSVVGFSTPLFSVAALTVFWVSFLLWWLGAYALHMFFSPDGTAFIGAVRGWRYIEREQAERHKRAEAERLHQIEEERRRKQVEAQAIIARYLPRKGGR